MSALGAAVFSFALLLQAPRLPSGTIQGIVCEVHGCSPIAGVRVSVEIPRSGEQRTVVSDEHGEFRFSQLPAGRYQLEADAPDFNPVAVLPLVTIGDGGRAEDVTVFMHAMGSIAGRAIDENGRPLVTAQVEALAFEQAIGFSTFNRIAATRTDGRGEFRLSGLSADEYIIRITGPFPPTFYPGTTSADGAGRISVASGSRITGIEIRLVTRGVTVTGRFTTTTGQAARAAAYLIPRTAATPISSFSFGSESMDERFEVRGVPPGSYYLYAVSDFNAPPQWVRIPIEVADKDIENVAVQIAPTGSLSGHVLLSPDPAGTESIDLAHLQVSLQPNETTPPIRGWKMYAEVSKTGEFHFDHIPEMSFVLSGPPSSRWFVSQVLLEGKDVTDSDFSTAPGENRTLEIVYSTAGGRLTGVIKDNDDKPVGDGRVALLAAPRGSTPTRITLASETGEFEMEMIPPGDYIAIAFPPETDVQHVEQYERYGRQVHIDAHETSSVEVVAVTPQ